MIQRCFPRSRYFTETFGKCTYYTIIDKFAVYRPGKATSSEFPRHRGNDLPTRHRIPKRERQRKREVVRFAGVKYRGGKKKYIVCNM